MSRDRMPPIELDLEQMRQNLLRQRPPRRVCFFEHAISDRVKDEVACRFDLDEGIHAPRDSKEWNWRREIAVQRFLGFELFRVWLPGTEIKVARRNGTGWEEEHAGPIQSWDDLDRYNWPDPNDIDYSQLEFYEKHLPEDMGVYHVETLWETVRKLFGFETFCYMLYEDPQLVDEVVRQVASLNMSLVRALCDFRSLFAIYGGDDYGYKTSTIMAPQIIIDKFLPGHREVSAHAHEHGKLFLFHCCGKVDALMDDLIDEVRIDAKHSFEDTIVPVTEAKHRWGDRVALLGGLDVDFVVRSSEEAIRQCVRETLDVCQPGGGYCLGMGNWVTEYVPLDHYLALLDEGRRYAV